MTTQKQNQAARLHAKLRADEIEFRRHLTNEHHNFERYLAPQKNGVQLDGTFEGYN